MRVSEGAATNFQLPEVEVKISKSWVRFVRWCQIHIPNGQVCFEIANAEPKTLVTKYTSKRIRFDKEQDFPVEFEDFSTTKP